MEELPLKCPMELINRIYHLKFSVAMYFSFLPPTNKLFEEMYNDWLDCLDYLRELYSILPMLYSLPNSYYAAR